MKDPFDRTKVVVRHLPPAISQSVLLEQIDQRFAGRYKWVCFRPGKNSQKQPRYSRAYMDFKKSEDVLEFALFFDGHVFVNEKGAQFKTIVEYAPSQRVPKPWSKKDGREGTIFKDPEYLEFLELLAKPAENLPSAEIQLERKEAERAGQPKESPVVTPLMVFVRQKRAAKSGSQRSSNGKLSRRASGSSPGSSSTASGKRGSEKRRISTSMYVLRDTTKNSSSKEKSTYLLVPKRDEQLSEKAISASGSKTLEDETATDGSTSGVSGTFEIGKKKVLLLKGKEREIVQASGGTSQHGATSHVRNSPGSTGFKQNQRREASGRIIRSILSNKDLRQNQPSTAAGSSDQQPQQSNIEKEKRPPRPTNIRSILKDDISIISNVASPDSDMKRALDDKVFGGESHSFISINEKPERRTRNKDRPDRGVWTPLCRSDGSQTSDDFVSSSSLQPTQLMSESLDYMSLSQLIGPSKAGDDVIEDTDNGSYSIGGKSRNLDAGAQNSSVGCSNNSLLAHDFGEMKVELPGGNKIGDSKNVGNARSSLSSVENGSHRHGGRRGPHGLKDDGLINLSEGKPSKRGATVYGSHEKQVWVQKSGPGS
ncbi:regulator of nonsense transcripts UPF3-like [Aristolochia californica]|uniref:regulator of nonsense transcripts UPF3-like n=1 Tax=Aristolochia californica TaxID=171875 RepID=UPI0035DCC258